MRKDAPCQDCPNRAVGCHSSCQRYRDWKERDHAQRMALREAVSRTWYGASPLNFDPSRRRRWGSKSRRK